MAPPAQKRAKRSSDQAIQKQYVSASSGSVFTASGKRISARIQKKKREVFICNDVLFDIFAKIGILRLGKEVATVSARFDALVDSRFKVKKRKLQRLWIRKAMPPRSNALINKTKVTKAQPKVKAELVTFAGKKLPFAKSPPPTGINGFKSLSISYIDAKVLEFLDNFRPLFNRDIAFRCEGTGTQHAKAKNHEFRQIWPLFYADIVKMAIDKEVFVRLRRIISPSVLLQCANLRFVSIDNTFLDTPPDDVATASPGKALFKWLNTPREDGRPKILTMKRRDEQPKAELKMMEDIKKYFLSATEAVSFIVRFRPSSSYWGLYSDSDDDDLVDHLMPFDLLNDQTGERLTLRHVVDEKKKKEDAAAGNVKKSGAGCRPRLLSVGTKFDAWLLERGPTKRDEQKWDRWAHEGPFGNNFWDEDNVVYVNLDQHRQLTTVSNSIRMICCCFNRTKKKSV